MIQTPFDAELAAARARVAEISVRQTGIESQISALETAAYRREVEEAREDQARAFEAKAEALAAGQDVDDNAIPSLEELRRELAVIIRGRQLAEQRRDALAARRVKSLRAGLFPEQNAAVREIVSSLLALQRACAAELVVRRRAAELDVLLAPASFPNLTAERVGYFFDFLKHNGFDVDDDEAPLVLRSAAE